MTGKPQVAHFLLSLSETFSGSCDRSGSRAVWMPRDRMDRPGQLFWKLLLLCLSASVHWDACQCQQVVQINEGPLFRAQGYPLTISCNVINSGRSYEQQFEFVMYSKSVPERMVNIISTSDPGFPYAYYSKRVLNGDIEVQRLSSFSVLFRIKELLKDDDGDFECLTPNQLGTYFGSYAAKTTVNVITDTLSVSSTGTDLTKTEGESLVLECQMSTQTFQHTHLSLTWYLQGESNSQTQPIISLDKDLTVRPGKGFEDRYMSGFISVDKVDETTYKLEMSKLQVTDQGKISCEGSEWIQDPDRSWYRLAQKNVTVSSLQVQPLIVDPNMDSFSVQLEPPKGGVREGEVLQLKCTVEAQKIQERYFSVAWLKDGREVARIGPRGVVSISQEYEARDSEGEMKVWKSSNKDYVLFIKPVRVMDTGEYQCRVWKEEKGAGGVFTQGRSQDSSVERVAITVPESNLVVTVPNVSVSVTQGSLLQLTCQVSGAKGQVSVAWQHRGDKGTTVDVINLSRSGVMEPGVQYRQRVQSGNVRALRPTVSDFTLEIANVLLTDSGVYRCTATDWVTERDDKVKNIDSKSQESTVSVVSLDSAISASLKSRNVRVTENNTIELICTVKRPEAPLSVTWKFQPIGAPSQEDIVLLGHNGDITWFKERRNYQIRVQVQAEETRLVLRVMRASASEAGAYQCVVDAFLQQVQTSQKLSNKLSVIVSRPESSLSIATGPQPLLEHDANSDVRMECRILKPTSNSSHFAVTWKLQRHGEKNQTVVSIDRDSVLSDPGAAERYTLRRREAQLFELLVPCVETRDSGLYHCLVEEWLQNSHGAWYSLPAKSDALELLVRPKRSGLSLLKSNREVSTAENEQVNISCTMEAGSTLLSSHYSVTWFFAKVNSSAKELLGKVGYDGVLDTSGLALELLERIRFYRPAMDTFSLTIQRVGVEDGGEYSCEVAEYQTDCEGNVMYIGSSKSGVTNVRVLLPESNLHVQKKSHTVTVSGRQGEGFAVDCQIVSRSTDKSVFEVTWWRQKEAFEKGSPYPIFRVQRDFTMQKMDHTRHGLFFNRPRADMFTLTVTNTELSDGGQYYCQVEEWQLTPRNTWRKMAEDMSGRLTVLIETKADSTLSLLKDDREISAVENQQVNINCSMDLGSSSTSSRYSVTWFFSKLKSSAKESLGKVGHNGVLDTSGMTPELLERIHFYRPALDTFSLAIQKVDAEDSGHYSCQVDEYRLESDGEFVQKAFDQSGVTVVMVHPMESSLQVLKDDRNVTVSSHKEEGFTVDCQIVSRLTDKSVFEVTWWRQKGAFEKGSSYPIFKVHHNFTMQKMDHTKHGLFFNRPRADMFTLMVTNAELSDGGQYYCWVEEWQLTPRNTWRKMAEDVSGNLTVIVRAKDPSSLTSGPKGMVVAAIILALLVVVLVTAVLVLSRKLQHQSAILKKKNASLWMDGKPLSPNSGDE